MVKRERKIQRKKKRARGRGEIGERKKEGLVQRKQFVYKHASTVTQILVHHIHIHTRRFKHTQQPIHTQRHTLTQSYTLLHTTLHCTALQPMIQKEGR